MHVLASYVTCGGGIIPKMNAFFPEIVNLIINIIKIGVPIVLIVLGMIDLLKGVMAQKEDEIKKAQGLFFKRLIAGVLVFFVVLIVEVIFKVLVSTAETDENTQNIWSCVVCFMDGPKNDKACVPVIE